MQFDTAKCGLQSVSFIRKIYFTFSLFLTHNLIIYVSFENYYGSDSERELVPEILHEREECNTANWIA